MNSEWKPVHCTVKCMSLSGQLFQVSFAEEWGRLPKLFHFQKDGHCYSSGPRTGIDAPANVQSRYNMSAPNNTNRFRLHKNAPYIKRSVFKNSWYKCLQMNYLTVFSWRISCIWKYSKLQAVEQAADICESAGERKLHPSTNLRAHTPVWPEPLGLIPFYCLAQGQG